MTALPLHLTVIDNEDDVDLRSNIRQIGPVLAQKMLGRNVDNRPVKVTNVARFAADMSAGRWLFDGAPIRFGSDGRLLDGQNRLHAIVQSGCTYPFLVVYGIDPGSQVVMDSGAARTSADNLGMSGERHTHTLAAILKLTVLYSDGRLDRNINYSVSSIEQAQFLASHPEMREAAKVGDKFKGSVGARGTAVGFAFWLFSQKDHELAVEFFDLLHSRVGLPERSPIIAVDSRFRQLRLNQQKSTVKQEINLLIKGWNLWISGDDVKSLQLPKPADPILKVKP